MRSAPAARGAPCFLRAGLVTAARLCLVSACCWRVQRLCLSVAAEFVGPPMLISWPIMSESLPPQAIAWSDEFATGVAELDRDHRQLLDVLNQLAVAVAGGDGRAIEACLATLERQVLEHFAREEAWFEQVRYARAAQHRLEHEAFHREIALQLAELHQRSRSLRSVALFVHDWLLRHLRGYDHHFVDAQG